MGAMPMEAAPSNRDLPEEGDLVLALFQRKIEFHLERRSFNGISGDGSDGFKPITLNPSAETPNVATLCSKPEKLERLDRVLDPDLSLEISFRRIGAGLRNLGNTCFLNSVLQCLTYTEPLAAYLQSGKHQNSCRKAGFCALCAIQKHVSRALQATGRILEPKDLVSNLRSISRNFRNARQEDAHEYMVNLLESMHKCCLPSGVPSESPSAYEKSLVHRIFGGHLRSQVKCMQCSFSSNKFDPFLDLSLEIVKAESVRRALSHFTMKEFLDGGAKQYQCQRCKQKVKALKQLTIHKAPNVLAIHLKRFSEHDPGKKINKDISFEPTLDLKPYVTGPYDGDLSYTLYGVLVHAGWNTHSGHYYCFVRTSSGMWYSLDDNQVVQVNERKVLDQKAYILFYFRDRKTLYRNKSVEVIKKESMVLNAIGNAACSRISVELKEKIQIGSVVNKLDQVSPASISEIKPVLSSAPKKTNLLEECADKSRTQTETIVPVDAHPVQSKFEGACRMQADGAENVVLAHTESQNGSAVVAEESNAPEQPVRSEGQNDIHSVVSKFEGTGEAHRDVPEKVLPDQNGSAVISEVCNTEDPGKCDVESVVVAHAVSQNGSAVVSGECAAPVPALLDGRNDVRSMHSTCAIDAVVQVSRDASTELLSSIQVSTEMVCRGKISKRNRKTVKRKPVNYCVVTTSFRPNILLWIALGIRKKHHKGRKKHSLKQKESFTTDVADGNERRSDNVPSVSGEVSSTMPVDQNSKLRGTKPTISSESSMPSAGKSPRSVLVSVSQMNGDAYLRKSRQDEVMRMLTGGFDGTVVARWDNKDASPAEKIEAPVSEPVRIGYVGDEWDEEYDKGKRKKIRNSRVLFSGPNLFQEIATRNLKRSKLHHNSSTDNRPFRIR